MTTNITTKELRTRATAVGLDTTAYNLRTKADKELLLSRIQTLESAYLMNTQATTTTITAKELRKLAYEYTGMTEEDLSAYNLRTKTDKELLYSRIMEAKAVRDAQAAAQAEEDPKAGEWYNAQADLKEYMEQQADEVAPEITEVSQAEVNMASELTQLEQTKAVRRHHRQPAPRRVARRASRFMSYLTA